MSRATPMLSLLLLSACFVAEDPSHLRAPPASLRWTRGPSPGDPGSRGAGAGSDLQAIQVV